MGTKKGTNHIGLPTGVIWINVLRILQKKTLINTLIQNTPTLHRIKLTCVAEANT